RTANNWFDQSFSDMLPSSTVYLVTLAKATANPLLKETDEEGVKEPGMGSDTPFFLGILGKKPVVVDLDGIAGRVVALPIPPGSIQNLTAGAEGQLLYIRRSDVRPGQGPTARGKSSLRRFDRKTREEETLAEGVDDFQVCADGKKLIYRAGDFGPSFPPGAPQAQGGLVLGIVDAGKFNKGDGGLKLDAISVRVEPRAEWPQVLREAWRVN